MPDYCAILNSAKKHFRLQSWVMMLFEALASLIAGGLFGGWLANDVPGWLLIVVAGVWVAFMLLRISSQIHFPAAIVDDLIAESQLESANKELVRRNIVLGFLSDSVTTLNGETCRLEGSDAQSFCKMSIGEGLTTVLEPLIQRPHQILGCIESKFSVFVGILDHSIGDVDDNKHPNQFLCLRDDFALSAHINNGLMRDSRASGFRLSAQEAVRRAFNENRMHRADAEFGSCKLSVMVSPLPVVCEPQNVDGVIVIFTNCGHQYPSDLEGTLKIYGQIISNWRWHYSECESRAKHGVSSSEFFRASQASPEPESAVSPDAPPPSAS